MKKPSREKKAKKKKKNFALKFVRGPAGLSTFLFGPHQRPKLALQARFSPQHFDSVGDFRGGGSEFVLVTRAVADEGGQVRVHGLGQLEHGAAGGR